MERPNTVAGLVAKRAELLKLKHQYEAEIKKIVCDVDHLNAAITLFSPEGSPRGLQHHVTQHRAKRGEVLRFVLDRLRSAGGPVTSRDVTDAWIKTHGLNADETTFILIRKRIGACLKALQVKGDVESVVIDGVYKAWVFADSGKNSL